MDRKISFQQAINEALAQEMAHDATVVVMGEDVVGGSGTDGSMDAWGGVLGVTKGLWGKFGNRVMDTPISESAFVGAAIGAAISGLRPVVELMFVDFMGVCFDQIFNQAAKLQEQGIATVATLAQIERDVREAIEAAVAFAKASPLPKPEDALQDVFAP